MEKYEPKKQDETIIKHLWHSWIINDPQHTNRSDDSLKSNVAKHSHFEIGDCPEEIQPLVTHENDFEYSDF